MADDTPHSLAEWPRPPRDAGGPDYGGAGRFMDRASGAGDLVWVAGRPLKTIAPPAAPLSFRPTGAATFETAPRTLCARIEALVLRLRRRWSRP